LTSCCTATNAGQIAVLVRSNREDAKNAKSGPASTKVTLAHKTAICGRRSHLGAGGSHFAFFASSRFDQARGYLTGIASA
jgi:hypothetical protein